MDELDNQKEAKMVGSVNKNQQKMQDDLMDEEYHEEEENSK